jgi:CheY-like chemotaxis protein
VSTETSEGQYALVVGEAGDQREQIANTLRLAGLPVVTLSVDEALAQPDLLPPGLVVLDVDRGREERRRRQDRLRRHPRLAHVPLLVLGHEADRTSFALAIAHGASAYLGKPVIDDVLLSVAQRLHGWRPEAVEAEKRRQARRPLLVPVDVQVRGRYGRNGAWIMDASLTGCRLETAEQLETGDHLRVWLHVPDAITDLPLACEARWAQKSALGLSLAGVRFTGTAILLVGKVLGLHPVAVTPSPWPDTR